jgi:hypothetical protein
VLLDELQINKYKRYDAVAITDVMLCEFKYNRMVMSVDWGEVIVCQFKILPHHSAGGIEYGHKSYKNSCSLVGICTRCLLNVKCVEHLLITGDWFEAATVLCTEF